MLDEATLAKHMETLGWPMQRYGESTFLTVHSTDEGEVRIFLRLSEHWLVASIVPFLETAGKITFELSRWLLRQNRDMYQTKFAYDEDGDIVLTVEVPTESLDYPEFRAALEGLLEAALEHRATLRVAAGG
ncbi:MAG: YbjN domain-containing protein [Myxococcales bacterium]|nr:YbjN domain-containing protein [Myxococcales bacterium]